MDFWTLFVVVGILILLVVFAPGVVPDGPPVCTAKQASVGKWLVRAVFTLLMIYVLLRFLGLVPGPLFLPPHRN